MFSLSPRLCASVQTSPGYSGSPSGSSEIKQEVVLWFKENNYTAANSSETIWIRCEGTSVLTHGLYADDFLHHTNDTNMYKTFQQKFTKRFEVKSGKAAVYLGNRITVDTNKLTVNIDQTQYIDELLERFQMTDCNPVSTPMVQRLSAEHGGEKLTVKEDELYRNMVGSLLYLACWTRPDISFAVSELSRFVSAPGHLHMAAAKHLIRYIQGSRELGIMYSKPSNSGPMNQPNVLWGFVDSDWAGCPDSRRSTTGFTLMLNGAAVAWKSKRQSVVALSSAEAEFMAASALVQEVIYARRLLENLGFPQKGPTLIYEDNNTCIAWSEGSVGGSDRAKHIDLREHFVHDAVDAGILKLMPVDSVDNVADLLTKPLKMAPFLSLRKRMLGI